MWEETTIVERARLFGTKLKDIATVDDVRTPWNAIFAGQDDPEVGTVLLNTCAPRSFKEGHQGTSLSEIYQSAGAPLEMLEELEADLSSHWYRRMALSYNQKSISSRVDNGQDIEKK